MMMASNSYLVGCDLGDPDSCYQTGIIMELSHEYAEARPRFRFACEKGVTAACESEKENRGKAKLDSSL